MDDVDRKHEKVLALGAEIMESLTKRPWGATDMSFYDPDSNMVFLRSFPENEQQSLKREEKTVKHTRWGISLAADVSAPRKV